jgi:hypothetical protein
MIGKPYAGELQVRFDEGNRTSFTDDPKRAQSWKRRIQPRISLRNDEPVLYSTAISWKSFDSAENDLYTLAPLDYLQL